MHLRNAEGTTLALTIGGYHYPRLADAPYDSNRLVVRLTLAGAAGCWTAADACLLTYEARRLADWLAGLAAGVSRRAVGFMEPCLRFEALAVPTGAALRVILDHAFRPPWAAEDAAWEDGYAVAFALAPAELAGAAAALRQELAPFPQRAAR